MNLIFWAPTLLPLRVLKASLCWHVFLKQWPEDQFTDV